MEKLDFRGLMTSESINASLLSLHCASNNLFCNYMDNFIESWIQDYNSQKDQIQFSDKIYLFTNLWKAILEELYCLYLPSEKYEFDWNIELTPSVLLLGIQLKELSNDDQQHPLFTHEMKEIYRERIKIFNQLLITNNLDDSDLEKNLDNALKIINLSQYKKHLDLIPKQAGLNSNKEKIILLLYLMDYPPLEELACFFVRYKTKVQQDLNKIKILLSPSEDQTKTPFIFNLSPILHNSYHYFDMSIFNNHNWEEVFAPDYFNNYRDLLQNIEQEAQKYSGKIEDSYICPCCGEVNHYTIPDIAIKMKILFTDYRELYKHLGFYYLDEFKASFINNAKETLIKKFTTDINQVDHPKCLILVEGESEEIFFNHLNLLYQIDFEKKGIKIFNAKSKEKLSNYFLENKEKYPNLKMVCLLDSDAIKERDDITRLLKQENLYHKYRLVFIEKGAFEDIFSLDIALEVINELYPNGEKIIKEDIDEKKEFAKSIQQILHSKKKEKFNKIAFAKNIVCKMRETKNIPQQVIDVCDQSLILVHAESKFLK